jgi:hypothetical protein
VSRSLALAWLVGLGVLSWREVSAYKKPVPAGRLGAASGVFLLLGLLSEYQPAAGAASLMAWAFDLAILLNAPFTPASPAKRTTAAGQSSGPQDVGAAPTQTGA